MKFYNRELSWLSFNDRVLQEAEDPSVPLFERIKFLAIFSSNLEEFFRVRVASLRSLLSLKKKTRKILDLMPEKLLKDIHQKVDELQEKFGKIFNESIIPELNKNNIFLKKEDELDHMQIMFIREYFFEYVYPNINPMMLLKGKVKFFLKTGSLYLAAKLSSKDKRKQEKKNRKFKYAIVEIPSDRLSRFVQMPSIRNEVNFIFLDDVIRLCLPDIFEGYEIIESRAFKLTRDAELYIDDEFSGNLLEKITKSLSKRMTGVPSRFLYDGNISKDFLKFLRESLLLKNEDLIPGGRYHNFSDFFNFPHPYIIGLEYEVMKPVGNSFLDASESMFEAINKSDSILHFPYQSFGYIIKFFEETSEDPDVIEIKITLYRVAKNSLIIKALINALRNGKKVTVFAEIKARFDEESNIEYARSLEKAGAKIIYSIPGLKVHAKLGLIVRNEMGSRKNYCYLSTGNFNEKTAGLYTDIGFFTSDERITNEVSVLFGFLEGRIKEPEFRNLLVAQFNMKKEFIQMIDNEIKNAADGKNSYIIIKLNNLEDLKIIEKLYEAEKAGVKIYMIVRGVCCLIPAGGITAISIIDRFLEHSRVFIFSNGGEDKIYLSSADWMKRNLSRRIEVAFPIYDETLKKEIKKLVEFQFKDNTKARKIDRNQTNEYKKNTTGKKFRSQTEIYNYLSL